MKFSKLKFNRKFNRKFNKMTIFLFLANLFIAFVMISLLVRGVVPGTQKMVKWSSVKSPEKAGDRLAVFLFPVLKESDRIHIQRGPGFSELFFRSFLKRARVEGIKTEIQQTDSMNPDEGFSIFILQLKDQVLQKFCVNMKDSSHRSHKPSTADTQFLPERLHGKCRLWKKVLNQFNKKKRDSSLYWITMDRLEKNKAVLFFQPPTGEKSE